jgi:predicted ATPase
LYEQQLLVRNGTVHLTRPLDELKIPPTVQAMLASRIDRLPPEHKELLQCLAVLGREFSLSLVRAVVRREDESLHRILDDLQLAEFIYEQPAATELDYNFKHALTQEVAYNSLLAERRKAVHESIAAAMERLYADRLEDHLQELAQHYRRSNNLEKAVYYLQQAGEQAVRRSVYNEAVSHFTTALELLSNLPHGPRRTEQELVLQVALGPALYTAFGNGGCAVGGLL